MSNRPVDKTKKSNIKCEHCLFADKDKRTGYWCSLHEKEVHYWNRCKQFEWNEKGGERMTREDEVITYFESLKKGLENFLKIYPSPATIGYQATLKEISFYDMAISALSEQKGDLIRRHAVLNKLNRLIEVEKLQGTDEMCYGRERVRAYERMIHEIGSEYLHPSVSDNIGEWIPVSEKLPEDGQFILASYPSKDSGCMIIRFRESCWYDFKAWQPLPEPYKKDEVNE